MLYDVSSSYYEGHACPLARLGHNRDGKKGLPIIVYGLLTDGEGRPVAINVYPGNPGDPTTVPDQVAKLRQRFGLSRVVLVGDGGMLTAAQIGKLKQHPGLGWISALRGPAIRELVEGGSRQLSLFDEANPAEISSPAYPGERLVDCFNPLLTDERRRKRGELIEATEEDLAKLAAEVKRRTRTPPGRAEITLKAGKVLHRHMEWHMRKDLAPLLFQDEELGRDRTSRDPVAPAECSASAQAKKMDRITTDGFPVHRFGTLVRELATRCRNTCRIPADPATATFQPLTEPTLLQSRAFQLLGLQPETGRPIPPVSLSGQRDSPLCELELRARALAPGKDEHMSVDSITEVSQYLAFKPGGEVFAIDVAKVREVLDLTAITRVPQTPEFMRGVSNLRGSVVPVAGPRLCFGMQRGADSRNSCLIVVEVKLGSDTAVIGALADSVEEVLDLEPDQIEAAPRIGTQIGMDFIPGIGQREAQFIIILDIDWVFTEDQFVQMHGTGALEEAAA